MKSDLAKKFGSSYKQSLPKNILKHHGILISFEGISGVGKSFFCKLAAAKLTDLDYKTTLISDLYDYDNQDIGKQILNILLSTKDKFFRIGYPKVEAMLLSAMKFYELEKWILPALKKGKIVLEDRSIDSVAIYSAILAKERFPETNTLKMYKQLFNLRKEWGILPDLTIYIKDNFNNALQRAEKRNKEKYKKDEIELLSKVSAMYDIIAQKHKNRIVVLNTTNLSRQEITKQIVELCLKQVKSKHHGK